MTGEQESLSVSCGSKSKWPCFLVFLAYLHQFSVVNKPFCRQCRPGLGRKSSSFQKHKQPVAMHQSLQDFCPWEAECKNGGSWQGWQEHFPGSLSPVGKICISTCESPLKSLLRPPSLLQGLPRRGSSVSAWIPQVCCWDPPSGLPEITLFSEGWDESMVCPCRNTLFETATEMSVGLGGRGWCYPGQEARGREGCNVRRDQPQGRGWLRGMTMSTVLLSRHPPEPRMETSKCSSWAYVY